MSKERLPIARSESSCSERRERPSGRRCQSQLSTGEHGRSPSQNTHLPSLTAYCAHCKHPLLIDVNAHEISRSRKSRASSTRNSQRLCQDCTNDGGLSERSPSSRLFKSSSNDWTQVGNKIETWFEKARTPDQRVVYNFLEQINTEQDKELDASNGKSLDDILNNLKKYRARFNSSNNSKKFHRAFESTSWRVMRHPSGAPRQFSRFNPVFGDDASRDFRISSVFTTTEPRIGSTFLLHPNWV